MARMHNATTIAIGDLLHAEFRAVADWLERHEATHFADGAAAFAAYDSAAPWQWIFLLAPNRATFDQPSVERLHRACPLARLVQVCGSWCEGETRSGKALAGVTRVAAHQFLPRAAAVASRTADYGGWTLPRTATPVDIALHSRLLPVSASDALVAVVTDLRDDYLALAAGLHACGIEAERGSATQLSPTAQAILWNGRSLDPASQRALVSLVSSAGGRPLIALFDFPRREERALAAELGAAAVIAKPFLLGDLRSELVRLGLAVQALPSRQAG